MRTKCLNHEINMSFFFVDTDLRQIFREEKWKRESWDGRGGRFETGRGPARCFETKEYDMVGMNTNIDPGSRNIRQMKMEVVEATRGMAEGLKEDNNVKSSIKVNSKAETTRRRQPR